MKIKGFTLVELMVVLAMVGIFATVSIVQYSASKERVVDREATSTLKMLREAQKGYKTDMYTYYPDPGVAGNVTDVMAINANLSVGLSNNTIRNWNYKVYSDGCVQAKRNGGDQRFYNLTIDYDGEPDSVNNRCPQ